MEPIVQYAKTSDGVNIAYWTMGEGVPLLIMPTGPFSHIQLEWEIPEIRDWIERIGRDRQLISYDPRGSGLSDRDVPTYAPEVMAHDIEAVADHLRLERFDLFAPIDMGAAGIFYAAHNPERVSHLILWCAYAMGSDILDAPETQSWLSLMDKDWRLVTQSWAHNMVGWSETRLAQRLATLWQECCEPGALPVFWNATLEFNVEGLLPLVNAPALVLHRRGIRVLTVNAARTLASKIPGARLILLDSDEAMPFAGDSEAVADAIKEFLGGGITPKPAMSLPETSAVPSGTAIILFADIADSTALTELLGDAAFRAKARGLDAALRTIIRDNAGTPIEGKLLGDGVLAVFTSARQAIEAAVRCGKAGDDAGLPLHLGINAGDVLHETDPDGRANVYGGAVNIAARIAADSAPGEVLVSETVRSLARTSSGVRFEDRGERDLKGVGEPVRVWSVRSDA
ncbi:MAG TPA: adenylate/guanylate cyclase domain-containing protein [Dehalococcoidia bacterium]|jgi:class 3 adenylate cyclase